MIEQISDADRERVTKAVADAEAKTSAEIVPAIAEASDGYDRPEDVAGIWLAGLGISAVWFLVPAQTELPGSWVEHSSWLWLLLILATGLLAFFVGAFAASQIDWLRKVFTPKSQMSAAVLTRASQAFFDNRIHHTDCSTGVLIYVSLYERQAVVLGDETVSEKLGPTGLEEICNELTAQMKAGHQAVDAVCAAIKATGDKLGTVLPRPSGDQNELKDVLIELGKP